MASFERMQSATEKHAAARDSIILQLIKLLLGLWSNFDRWDDVDVVAGMAARSASLVDASTDRVRRLSRSYLASVLAELGAPTSTLPAIVNGYPRANVNADEVYRRPVADFIWSRRSGAPVEESQKAFEDRLRGIAEADVMAAERDEHNLVLERTPKVTGFRRIIHPELSRSGTCGLCVVASQRIYHTSELLPLHGGDNCDMMPITDDEDPGFRLNEDDLKTVYAAAGSTSAEDLINTRISIDEHGELGPVLVKQGDHFKTAEDAGRPAYVKQTPAIIRRDREAERTQLLADLERAQSRYDAEGSSLPDDIRIPLFRSIKYMRERSTQLDAFLRTLAG